MIFITQGRFTQQAMQGMVARPEDRSAETRGLVERAGGRVLGYWMTLGEYDFLIVTEGTMELKDFVSGLAIVAAGGGVTDLRTTVAFTPSEMKAALEKAHGLAAQFRSAGQAA